MNPQREEASLENIQESGVIPGSIMAKPPPGFKTRAASSRERIGRYDAAGAGT
jgi:hypothetical protein